MCHTPTPKQTSVSKSHNPYTSLLLCEALSHTLSLLTSLAATSAPCWRSDFTLSGEALKAAQWRGVWGKEENVKNKKNERILSPIPFSLSLSLSLSYQILSHSLSLSLHFLHFSALAYSLNTRGGRQWQKHLPTEKYVRYHIYSWWETHRNCLTHRDGRGRERERVCVECAYVYLLLRLREYACERLWRERGNGKVFDKRERERERERREWEKEFFHFFCF